MREPPIELPFSRALQSFFAGSNLVYLKTPGEHATERFVRDDGTVQTKINLDTVHHRKNVDKE